MNYTRTMILTVPVELIEVANKLAQAFDPDSQGCKTFNLPPSVDPMTGEPVEQPATVSASTPITEQLYEVAPYMLADAEALHASTLLDYETRWPELVAPTIEEVTQFCDCVTVELI